MEILVVALVAVGFWLVWRANKANDKINTPVVEEVKAPTPEAPSAELVNEAPVVAESPAKPKKALAKKPATAKKAPAKKTAAKKTPAKKSVK